MRFLEYYYETIIKYDLTNKFLYKNTKEIPKLKKIILNFECKNFKIKEFASTLLTLELIITKPSTITNAKTPNLFLKIQKGQPTGCKIILTKNNMYLFLSKIFMNILPKIKNFLKLKRTKNNINVFSFTLLNNNIFFSELQDHFNLINQISDLHIVIVTNAKTQNELFFLLKSFKLPVKL